MLVIVNFAHTEPSSQNYLAYENSFKENELHSIYRHK